MKPFAAITVTVASVRGSAPREVGASMTITAQDQTGTIGGGALEWDATQTARDMLAKGVQTRETTVPLGPGLGQCCGGTVVLRFEQAPAQQHMFKQPIWVWGAGHVGRALITVLAPLPNLDITWIDTAPDRFPQTVPTGIAPLVAQKPTQVVRHAPGNAAHIILTYSHDIDLHLCDALLHHGFDFAGLIGSATKWARFRNRLAQMGHAPETIAQICCPIGQPELGKHPAAIALGVAAQLITLPKHVVKPETITA